MGIVKALLKLRKKIKIENLHCNTFLDAGCGLGNILLLAEATGFGKVIGLELDLFTLEKANQFLGTHSRYNECIEVKQADILTYKNYKKANVIYFYRPFCNSVKQLKFEIHLMNLMRVGAHIMPVYDAYGKYQHDVRFELVVKLPLPIYQKINNQRGKSNKTLESAEEYLKRFTHSERSK